MKVPTDGTKVFAPIAVNNATGTTNTTNFPVDMQISNYRDGGEGRPVVDRLRGVSANSTEVANWLWTNSTVAEQTSSAVGMSLGFDNTSFKTVSYWNSVSIAYWNFRRAPGFFDEVCYTGTGVAGQTISHNLGAVPELMIMKRRNAGLPWGVYYGDNTDYLILNTTAATADDIEFWNDTSPTASVFSLGVSSTTNDTGSPFVAYLFASCPGVSKVFNFTGNGSSQTINCGFTGGARFVMIKRTDSTGDWYVWDTARGIVANNDPHLSLNTTAAEVTSNDTIDTDSTGFVVNQVSATNVNVNGATYIGLAIA
jgi:hypothetical protein